MAREVKLWIELRDWQKEILSQDKRFQVLVCHRRAWKTIISLLKLLKDSLKNDNKYYWYISPTYKQSKLIAWDILCKMVRNIPWVIVNQSELKVTFENWSRIQLFWADYPDSLRWLDIYWVIFDEYAQQPSSIYWEIVFPMINANNWWATWIWTPKWKNDFYKLYKKAKQDEKYYTKILPVSESKLLDKEQLQAAREEMTQEEYDQEYECSFTAAIKWAYYKSELAKAREEWRIKFWLYDPVLPVFTVWDLWISDNMAILFVQVQWWLIRIIDSYSTNWKWFDHFAKIIHWKDYNYDKHFFPHDIDQRELTTWQSRLETVRKLFWANKCQVLPKMKVIDWINAVRLMFRNLWIDEKLEDFINAISLYRQKYDDKRWIFLDTPEHDWTSHYADALRYVWMSYNFMTATKKPTTIYFPDYI